MMPIKFRHMLLAAASASSFALGAAAFAQSADDQAPSSDDVATEVVENSVVDETTAVEDVVEPVPVEWVERDGGPDVIMYSMMGFGGMEDPADDIAARAAEQAATQAMDHIDATNGEAPLP